MTRKKWFLLHVLGFAGFCGTLLAVAEQQVAAEAIGFALFYLGLMVPALLLRLDRLPVTAPLLMAAINFTVIGAGGGPRWALVAVALTVVTWWPRRRAVRA